MPDEQVVTAEMDDAEFDAAFAESAKISEGESGQDPGEVGAQEAGEDDGQAFQESFTDAAVNSAASKGETGDVDLSKRLEEIQADNERLKQSERSQRGRVKALTKKLEEQRAASVPLADQQASGDTDGTSDDDWEEFKREFPEMAAIVDGRLKKVSQKVDSVNDKVKRVSETQDTMVEAEIIAYKETQFEALKRKHSDFEAIKVSKEFADFKANATPEIQAKIKSKHAEDAIAVLDSFKESTGWKGMRQKPGKSEVELLNERRAAALRQSTGISSKQVGHSTRQDTGSSDDFDEAFKEGASKKEKERSFRY
jgi:hypothetical protein